MPKAHTHTQTHTPWLPRPHNICSSYMFLWACLNKTVSSPLQYHLSLIHLDSLSSRAQIRLSLFSLSPMGDYLPSRNLVQPSAFLLAAWHWQTAARRTHWRAVESSDTVNPLWMRKLRHDVPGKGTSRPIQSCTPHSPEALKHTVWMMRHNVYCGWTELPLCNVCSEWKIIQWIWSNVWYSHYGASLETVFAYKHAAVSWNVAEFIGGVKIVFPSLSHSVLLITYVECQKKEEKRVESGVGRQREDRVPQR